MRKHLLPLLSLLIVIPAAASISGVVITTDGQPIAGAKISIYAPETIEAHRVRLFSKSANRTPLSSKQTDSKGTFVFDSPKDQSVVDVQVEATGFAPESVRLLALTGCHVTPTGCADATGLTLILSIVITRVPCHRACVSEG